MRLFAILGAAIMLAVSVFGGNDAKAQDTSSLKAIQDRGTLRMGVAQSPPWFFKPTSQGEWTGLGVSMAKEMASTLGVELEYVETTWGNAVAALQADQMDLMFVLDATPARALAVDFPSAPLLYYALAVLHKDDFKVTSWDALNSPETRIAVAQGTAMDAFITERLDKAEIQRFAGLAELVAAFQSGRVDAVSMFHPALISFRKKLGSGTITLPTPVRASASSVGIRRQNNKDFRDWVNTAVAYYYTTGRTQQWFAEALRSFDVDPKAVPPIQRELWD